MSGAMVPELAIPIASLLLFNVLQLVASAAFALAKGVRVARPYWLLLLGVFLAVAFRLAYVFVWWLEPTAWVARAVTSRTAIIAATATLAMLLWSWIQAVHGQFAHGTRVFFLVTQISLTTVTAVLALSMFVVGVVEAATFAPAATSARIVIDFLIIAVLVTFGFAFLLYGIILFVMLRRSELSARRDQAVSVIVISIFIFCGYAMSLTGLWQNAIAAWFWLVLPVEILCFVSMYLFLSFATQEVLANAERNGEASVALLSSDGDGMSNSNSSQIEAPSQYSV